MQESRGSRLSTEGSVASMEGGQGRSMAEKLLSQKVRKHAQDCFQDLCKVLSGNCPTLTTWQSTKALRVKG